MNDLSHLCPGDDVQRERPDEFPDVDLVAAPLLGLLNVAHGSPGTFLNLEQM